MTKLRTIPVRNRLVLFLNDFKNKPKEIISLESVLQSAKLVKDDAQRPNIAFRRVRLTLTRLRTHVVWGSDDGLRSSMGILQNFTNAKISELDRHIARQENVLGFKVSVDDLALVNVLQGEANLNEPIENISFLEILVVLYPSPYVVAQVPHIAVLHYDDQDV